MKKQFTAFLFLLLSPTCLLAQQSNSIKENIAEADAQYFELDRETIYAQFDKSIFFTNEEIWFKGYVYNKKNGTPFFETTNVYALLYDDAGKILDEQLLFSYLGTFSGTFKLLNDMKSGRYYVRFYTNWMNNFPEDESAVFPVQIVNENDSTMADYSTPDYSTANIAFHAEGGNFVEGVANNLGIKLTDCNGNPIAAADGKIVDPAGETLSTFTTTGGGYARTHFTPTTANYKAVFSAGGRTVEAALPKAGRGIAIEVNNFALPGKTVIKLAVNQNQLPTIANSPLFVVIEQNNKTTIFETSFNANDPQKELVVTNDNLYKGINTIRIIDSKMQQLAERLIFSQPDAKAEISLSVAPIRDTLRISGKSRFANADLSVSVLPANSMSSTRKDIFGELMIGSYIAGKIGDVAALINDPTKAHRFELDVALLSQQSKYKWEDIMAGAAKQRYDFDIGLTVKGTINQSLSDPKKYRMQLSAPLSLINDYSEIDAKNNFEFKNLVFGNMASFRFTLLKIPSIPTDMKFFHNIVNRKRTYNKVFSPSAPQCTPREIALDMPQFGNDVVQLENINIAGKAKSDLKYRLKYGNSNLRGYKITDMYKGNSVLDFIGANGFDVTLSMGDVTIGNRLRTTLNAQPSTPEVYVNDRLLMSHDELQDINLQDVDEIYLNPHAIVPSIKNNMGIIKIYLKKLDFSNAKTQTQTFEIKEGFAKIRNFENALYLTNNDKGFQDFGVVHWAPTVLTNENGDFKFEIPKTDAKNIVLKIEGFTPEGNFVSETKTLTLP